MLAAFVGGVTADVGDFGQHLARVLDHPHAGRGDALQAAALATEQLEAEFVLQLLELLGQARLGGMHALGRLGDVQAGIGDGDEVAQLGQGHGGGAEVISLYRDVAMKYTDARGLFQTRFMRLEHKRKSACHFTRGRSAV